MPEMWEDLPEAVPERQGRVRLLSGSLGGTEISGLTCRMNLLGASLSTLCSSLVCCPCKSQGKLTIQAEPTHSWKPFRNFPLLI